MSDITTAAPVGASEQITAPTDTGPTDRASAVALLAGLDTPPEAPAAATPEANTQEPVETPTEEAPAEAAAADEGEDAPTEEVAATEDTDPKADDEEPEVIIHGNAMLVLRDGTKVRASEARKAIGTLREYEAKVPDLAATAARIQEREAQLAQQEQTVQNALAQAYQIVNAYIPPAPDPALRHADFIGYMEQKELREEALNNLRQVQSAAEAEQAQHLQKSEQAREAERKAMLERSYKTLSERVPGIDSPEGLQKFYGDIAKAAAPYGISAEEVNNTVHAPLLHMVHEMSKEVAAYRKLMAQKATAEVKAKAAPPVQPPGRRVSAEQAANQASDTQLRQWRDSGASRAGAAAILGNLD